jgi:hypothetical protein
MAGVNGSNVINSQALVDSLNIVSCMTRSSVFWHIARVVTSTGLSMARVIFSGFSASDELL